jgi:hypothetical protein
VTSRELRQQLEDLQQTLESASLDQSSKDKLSKLVAAIESELQSPPLADDSSLPEQLDELVAVFESEHPTLSGILNRIMVTLSSMGV